MESDNPFDRKLESNRMLKEYVRAGLVDTADTLDFAWAAAQSVFGDAAKPEHAIALLPFFIERIDVERRRADDEWNARMADAAKR